MTPEQAKSLKEKFAQWKSEAVARGGFHASQDARDMYQLGSELADLAVSRGGFRVIPIHSDDERGFRLEQGDSAKNIVTSLWDKRKFSATQRVSTGLLGRGTEISGFKALFHWNSVRGDLTSVNANQQSLRDGALAWIERNTRPTLPPAAP